MTRSGPVTVCGEEAAKKLGISLLYGGVDSPVTEAEYRRVFGSIQRDQVDGIIFSAEFEHYPHALAIVRMEQEIRLPTIHEVSEFVEAGSLMSYGFDWRPAVRTLATKSAEIFKGANPGDMPYVQEVRFELVINLTTAESLGLELPPSLLARADR